MSLYRLLLLRRALRGPSATVSTSLARRAFAFSSAEEAAAERRRRKRQLRIEPPLHALHHRDPNAPSRPPPPRDPRLPDTTSALTGPRLNLHNRVQSLIRAGDLDAASATARQSVFSSVRPTVFTCNAVIAAMHRAGRLDDAIALFTFFFRQSNIVPNVVSYNNLINAHCDAGRVDVGLEVYRHILAEAPFSPSPVTYRHLTKGLVDSNRIGEAVSLLREMLHRGHAADSIVYSTLMAGFIDRDDMDRALELFEELRERCLVYDGIVHATLMGGYFKKGMESEAMESYQSLLDRQFKMNAVTCNTLLEVLLKHDKVKEAEALFERMLTAHTPPSFHGVNIDTYNILVNECFKKRKFDEAIKVFHRTGTKPCVMDVGCFNNIIGKLCENGLVSDAEKLFEEMPGKSVNPDAATYGFLVDACFKEARADDALRYYEKVVGGGEAGQPGPRVNVGFYNKMFDGLVKAGRAHEADEIFGKMCERGLKADPLSYEILITGLCKEGSLDRVGCLLNEVVRSGVATSSELHEIVLDAFGKEGRCDEVTGLFPGNLSRTAPQAEPVAA